VAGTGIKSLRNVTPVFYQLILWNKTLEANLSLILKLNWKITNTTPNDPMNVMRNMLRNLRPLPLLFCELKLMYLYKCVHSNHQKE
jgi:hypothetical protein